MVLISKLLYWILELRNKGISLSLSCFTYFKSRVDRFYFYICTKQFTRIYMWIIFSYHQLNPMANVPVWQPPQTRSSHSAGPIAVSSDPSQLNKVQQFTHSQQLQRKEFQYHTSRLGSKKQEQFSQFQSYRSVRPAKPHVQTKLISIQKVYSISKFNKWNQYINVFKQCEFNEHIQCKLKGRIVNSNWCIFEEFILKQV